MICLANNWTDVSMVILTGVTVIIAIFSLIYTGIQVHYTKQSVEQIYKQIQLEKQPCVVPRVIDSSGVAFDTGTYTRVQLSFDLEMENVGDAPALNVFVLSSIRLNLSSDSDVEKQYLLASLLPGYIQALKSDNKQKISIHYETPEMEELLHELEKATRKNLERIENNPSQWPYVGATLIVQVIYKNIMGQWCESVIQQDIADLIYEKSGKNVTDDIGNNEVWCEALQRDKKFYAVLLRQQFVPFTHKLITEDKVKKVIEWHDVEKKQIVKWD